MEQVEAIERQSRSSDEFASSVEDWVASRVAAEMIAERLRRGLVGPSSFQQAQEVSDTITGGVSLPSESEAGIDPSIAELAAYEASPLHPTDWPSCLLPSQGSWLLDVP